MEFDPAELDTLSREDLILRARARGVQRPEQMTRVELRDEIVRLSEPDLERQRRTRGWLGVARDLLASVVESGLNLPDAASAIRGDAKADIDWQGPPPVATVTLAEIYMTQGHYDKALRMLDEVLQREPDHASALTLRKRLVEERDAGPNRKRRSEPVQPTAIAAPVPQPTAAPVAAPAPPPEPFPAPEPEPEPAPLLSRQPEPEPEPAPAPVAAPEPVPAPEPVAEPEPEPVAAPAPAAADAPALLVLRSDDRAFVYWRLPALSDSVRLRAVTVRPASHGPAVEEEDHLVTLPVGGFWLPRLAPGTEVRAAIGEVSNGSFSPVTVARVLTSDEDAAFEPPGTPADPSLEAEARSAAGL